MARKMKLFAFCGYFDKIKNQLPKIIRCFSLFLTTIASSACEQSTPYKYTTKEREQGLSTYKIPPSSRFTTKRSDPSAPDIIYYLTIPPQSSFPIAILCGGSSLKNDVNSIIHFHRYFLQEFLDCGAAVLTVEQQGVDGNTIDVDVFIEHYTRSERLSDHQKVIDHLKANPPNGWNGKLLLLGVSEGGPLVTTLTTNYSDIIAATINWVGASGWSWRDELWAFTVNLDKTIPWHFKLRMKLPEWMPFSVDFHLPNSREEFDTIMDKAICSPTVEKEFLGMTYKYHADALKEYPRPDYSTIKTPFLVVSGEQDTVIHSCDLFVEEAKKDGAPITYLRISKMGHYIRERPDVVAQSFEWLKLHI
jgi:pimeloyl-ACP methyl ester carboxylesterase